MIGLNDVGVDQVGDELGFTDKIVDELLLVRVILANDLQRDAFDEVTRAALFGLVDDTHAAFENFADDLVPKLILNGEQTSHDVMLRNRRTKSSLGWKNKCQKNTCK